MGLLDWAKDLWWYISEGQFGELEHPREKEKGPYPEGPLPAERIRPPSAKGACGVTGCPNRRPHSHVEDLARRMREKK